MLADPAAQGEIGTETYRVTATVTEGSERERLWAQQLLHTPYFAGFQERAGRQVPVVALTRGA